MHHCLLPCTTFPNIANYYCSKCNIRYSGNPYFSYTEFHNTRTSKLIVTRFN